jgi:hypothetical protein
MFKFFKSFHMYPLFGLQVMFMKSNMLLYWLFPNPHP